MSEPKKSRSRLTLDEFSPHSYEEWKTAAIALLKGASFEKKLFSHSPEKITLHPLYRREDSAGLGNNLPGLGTRIRGSRLTGNVCNPWAVSQESRVPDPRECNQYLTDDLQRGQTEVRLVLDETSRRGTPCGPRDTGPDGLILLNLADLETALRDVDLNRTAVSIDAGFSWPAATALLLALARKQQIPPHNLRGGVRIDPLAQLAVSGTLPGGLEKHYDLLKEWLNHLQRTAPGLGLLECNAAPVHDCGGSAVDELSWLAASLAETIRQLDQRDLSPETTLQNLHLTLACGGSFFMEIAKFRAARILFSHVTAAFGVPDPPLHIHARSGRWNLARLDPHVNLLRTTLGAFAAIAGGCDSLHVIPFDEVNGPASPLSRRLARNIQLILRDECELKRVIDPAGGAYAVEVLTDRLARDSWEAFRKIEAGGGLARMLQEGTIQEQIRKTAGERRQRLAMRSDVLVGCNMYPIADEPLLPPAATISDLALEQVRARCCDGSPDGQAPLEPAAAIAAAEAGCRLDALLPGDASARTTISPLPAGRAAGDFEDLRLKAAEPGQDARIFQANIGPSRQYRARADWTTGFFQVGGFQVSAATDFASATEAAEAALQSGAPIVVLTGSDETYPEAVPCAARILKTAPRPPRILVAGAPGELEAAWRDAGVDDFVHARVNCLETLQQLLQKTGGRG